MTFEEFSTLLTQIEALLNSRQSIPLDNPHDSLVLTLLLTEFMLTDAKMASLVKGISSATAKKGQMPNHRNKD